MTRTLFKILLTLSLFFSLMGTALAIETYQIDPSHTYVLWRISHFGFSEQFGKFTMVDGTIKVDEAKPDNSSANIIIHTDKIATGIPKLDEHLLSADFFNVAKYPTATFVSNKIIVTGKHTGKIHGTLTLLGVSKPVTLDVTLLKSGMNIMKNKKSIGFSATTKINRSEFGMVKYSPALGDEVEIIIGVEADLV